jgi:hypothetical protein
MRRILAACCLCLLSAPVRAQDGQGQRALIAPGKVPVPPFHFQPEYTFDAPGDPARWSAQPRGLSVSFASTDQAYFRSEVPDLPQASQVWEASGWKGERLNGELVVWSPDSVNQIRVAVGDLVNDKGNVLPGRNVHVFLVRYVVSNYPYDAHEVSCGVTDSNPPYLMPDRLEPFEARDVRPGDDPTHGADR